MKEERQSAVEAILNSGHIPAGMELFTAGDESQWTIIKRWIEESDVYMLLLGGRYGSIEEIYKKSYTHLEYEYALKLGKPLFVIVINDKALDEKVNKEGKKVLELNNPQGLTNFKKVVISNMCAFWDDLKDIKLSINDSIRDIEYRYASSLKGWVKADDTDYSSISEELARLSKENSELKSQLDSQNISTIAHVVEFLSCKGVSNKYEIIRGFEVIKLLDYFLTCAYNEDIKAMAGSLNPAQDLHKLQAIGLLESKTRNLSEKGKEVFLYFEINNIEIQEKPEI